MSPWLAFGLGVFGGFILVKGTFPVESSCCTRVANAGRDEIAGLFGDAKGPVASFLDGSGLTNAIPGWLDALGVSKG